VPRRRFLFAVLFLPLLAAPTPAVEPADVFLVVNKNVPASLDLAEHYCGKRGVPKDNIVALDLPTGEDINRKDYDERLAAPLREKLKDRRDKVKVLLTFYGVPLRVGGDAPNADEKAELDKVNKELGGLREKVKALDTSIKELEAAAKADPKGDAAARLAEARKERDALNGQVGRLDRRRAWLSHAESQAAVDSELALLWSEPYELRRWRPNPLYFRRGPAEKVASTVVMTCRLDGPSPELVKRIIDQSVEVEKKGLSGRVYVDARGIKFDPGAANDGGWGYGGYDQSLRDMAKLLGDAGLDVTLDDKPELFAPGACPDAALYCGWYSLAKYVACCRFAPGAVAYHIASSEAVSLRDPKAPYWCKNLLEAGCVATLGPVAEPYTIGFPKPAEFFGFLATGQYPLVECYWKTQLFTSWMTVLVGDPLYNPFAKAPKLRTEQVKPSPEKGGPPPR
jgi:uncharacterized protein (TIGR03790 family)